MHEPIRTHDTEARPAHLPSGSEHADIIDEDPPLESAP